MQGYEGIIFGALGTLFATSVAPWIFFALRRVPPPTQGRVPGSPGVHAAGVSGLVDGVPGPGTRVPGRDDWVSEPEISRKHAPPTIQMGASLHASEFIEFMMADGYEVSFPRERMVQQYRAWAAEFSIVPLPPSIFLAVLAAHPQVERKRVRKKDRNGRVLRTETDARSPQRERVYVISPPRKLPGKVPVADLVEARPVATKAQRKKPSSPGASVAQPQPRQPEQPEEAGNEFFAEAA